MKMPLVSGQQSVAAFQDHNSSRRLWARTSNFGDPHLPGFPARFGKVSDRSNWAEQNINRAGFGRGCVKSQKVSN